MRLFHHQNLVLPSTSDNFYKNLKLNGENIKNLKVNSDGTISIIFKHPNNHEIVIFNTIRYVAALLPKGYEDCLSIAGEFKRKLS